MRDPRRAAGPWAVVLGLITAVAINLGMVWIAVAHRSAPVPGDPEADALGFDDTLAQRRASAALGWRVEVGPCRTGAAGQCELTIDVLDRDGRGVEDLRGRVVARRADDASFDRDAELRPLGLGHYAATLPTGAPGRYALAITLDGEASAWGGERELWVPATTEGP